MSLVMVVIWGVLSDHHEKRWIMCAGLFFMGLPVVVYPYCHNVYPSLLILRLIFSIGTAATTSMMAAFLTEVVRGQGGWISAMLGASSGLGAIFAVFELFLLPSQLNYHYRLQGDYTVDTVPVAYGIVGGLAIFFAIALMFLLPKSPRVLLEKKRNMSRIHQDKSRLQLDNKSWFIRWYYYILYGFIDFGYKLYRGILATKDPRIALGYTTSFFARADEVIITNFISLWVTQYYIEQGICSPNERCYASAGSSGALTGIAQAVALAACPFFGAGSEYLAKEFPIILAGMIGAAGCIPFAFSIDPTSNASMAFVVLLAIGQYGMIISGMTMIAGKHVPVAYRGSVAGTYSFFGAIGIIIISKIGGVLFDKWMKGAPFLLLGIGHCLVLVFAIIVFIWRRYFHKEEEDHEEEQHEYDQYSQEKNNSSIH
ncbi:major facilitator superfamily domain-containing protein [Cunninghamella echinulata]|nr:major facilitator superfamily domain-containing protein [Cunninghamella echinulata]